MADAKEPWNEVGDRLAALALKLKMHAKEELSEERKAEARSAVERFGTSIQGAVDALGDAVRDPAVKEDAKAAGHALSNAVTTTVEEVLRVLRESSPRVAGGGGTDAPSGSEGSGEAAAGSTDGTAAAGRLGRAPGSPQATDPDASKDA